MQLRLQTKGHEHLEIAPNIVTNLCHPRSMLQTNTLPIVSKTDNEAEGE